ncbi:MAG: putative DNA binding domain-containing protein [Desulfobacteraceae bacterium]|nr:putative DNA binding domain-containing protein [Desulfobacteraceae bacterium]
MNESQHTEWKQTWRDDHLKSICGFANAEGGVLVIGRRDDGRVTGIANAHRLLEDLPNKVRDMLGIMVDVNLRTRQGKEYLEIRVPAYPNPVSYKGEYYYRSGSTLQRLKGAALDRFLLRRHGRTWDGVPQPGVSAVDLDSESLERFRRRAARSKRLGAEVLEEKTPGLIEKLRLVEGKYLKRAAILLFHPEPDRFFSGAMVKIGYFAAESDLRYHDEICGGLFSQVEKTMDLLLTKYLKAGITYDGIQRVETYPVPEAALREAVLNAIVHRDYAVAAPIQIRVYADRLLIWNPGELPENWSKEKLLSQHPSKPFNPDVANAFFRAGEIEAWGRGIYRIFEACGQAGTPEPEIRVEPGEVWVEFTYSKSYLESVSSEEKIPGASEKITQETTQEAPPKASEKTSEKTSEKLTEMIRETPTITIAEMARAVGKSTRAVEMQLAKLREAGRIRRVGPRKGGRWEILGESDE